jgi:DNA-binding MarR family transcriptional regulator/ribosomal protein S18 acetylase RimI-like enzyme
MAAVDVVRSFNRTITRRIGALDEDFLGRHRSLGACRVLFEIGGKGVEVRALRARLDLDSGYLSRLLRGLERERLIRTTKAPDDARVGYVILTPAGRKELAALNRLADRAAASMLETLTQRQQQELAAAMAAVERLLRAGNVRVEVTAPTSRGAGYCLERYFEELAARFEGGFDPKLSISAATEELTPPRGYFVLATLEGDPVGCGALKCQAEFGEIKRMWVKGSARGLGIGRRILEQLEDIARTRGLLLLRLETNDTLKEAQALYRGSGYREVPAFNDEPYAHHWFEKSLSAGAMGDER